MNKPFDPTKPVQTRDGRKARIVSTKRRDPYPIIAIVEDGVSGFEFATEFQSNGNYIIGGYHKNDLINVPETKTVEFWVNVYGDGRVGDFNYKSLKEAKDFSGQNIFAHLHIKQEVKEGEGL